MITTRNDLISRIQKTDNRPLEAAQLLADSWLNADHPTHVHSSWGPLMRADVEETRAARGLPPVGSHRDARLKAGA